MDADDVTLLGRWRAGDSAAGNELIGRHFHAVLRVFRYKVEEPEELVQRTFLSCIEHRDDVADPQKFRRYLLRIARNELYMHLRRELGGGVELASSVTSIRDLHPSPSSVLRRERDRGCLLEALRRIPLDYQIALELYYWEGLTGEALAEVLETPVGTARSRLRLGKAMLRRELARVAETWHVTADADDLDRWAAGVRDRVERAAVQR
jgi:RNA polymerase sigma factor (sigma-70 family)